MPQKAVVKHNKLMSEEGHNTKHTIKTLHNLSWPELQVEATSLASLTTDKSALECKKLASCVYSHTRATTNTFCYDASQQQSTSGKHRTAGGMRGAFE